MPRRQVFWINIWLLVNNQFFRKITTAISIMNMCACFVFVEKHLFLSITINSNISWFVRSIDATYQSELTKIKAKTFKAFLSLFLLLNSRSLCSLVISILQKKNIHSVDGYSNRNLKHFWFSVPLALQIFSWCVSVTKD